MKIAVTGHEGYLGSYLVKAHNCIPVDGDILSEMDMHNADKTIRPDVLIHCASMTNVDECEKNPDQAFRVNTVGTMNVVNAFYCPIIYLSTDHVFNGKARLWLPNEKTKPDPLNIYGMTKYAGEVMALTSTYPALVVRSSKLFDVYSLLQDIKDLQGGVEKEFTGLIHRNFTHRNHFADMLIQVAIMDWDMIKGRILHLATPLSHSYYQFWKLVAEEFDIDTSLVIERKYPLDDAVPRPFRGGLDTRKASKLLDIPSVKDGIRQAKLDFYREERQ